MTLESNLREIAGNLVLQLAQLQTTVQQQNQIITDLQEKLKAFEPPETPAPTGKFKPKIVRHEEPQPVGD